MDTVSRIFMLMEERNVTAAQVTKEAGLTSGLLTQWKQRKQKPSTEAIVKLATYFNVSVDYLLGLTDENDKLATGSGKEQLSEFAVMLEKLSPEALEQVKKYTRFVLDEQEKEKSK